VLNNKPFGLQDQGIGKLVFLGGLSALLSSFGPLSLFSAAPVALAFLLFGLTKTYVMGAGFALLLFLVGQKTGFSYINGAIFLSSFLYGMVIYQIILKDLHPMKGIIKYGSYIIAVATLLFSFLHLATDFSVKQKVTEAVTSFVGQIKANEDYTKIVNQGGEQAEALQDLVKRPELLVKEIISWSPSLFVISVFLSIWVSLFLVLKNSLVWRQLKTYSYGIKDLIKFKTPDFLIYPVLLGLVLALVGDQIWPEWGDVVGFNILYSLGVFYFFQGFGVFLDLLNYLKIYGVFRAVFFAMVILMAWRVLAIVGLFDHWFDFRKFFKNKKEGDNV